MPGMATLHFRGCGRVIVVVVFGIRLDLRPTHRRRRGVFFFFSSSRSGKCSKDEVVYISCMHDEVLNTNVTTRQIIAL